MRDDLELVVAADADWGIGKNGTQTLVVPEDRRHFREVTGRGTVIVGRKTLADFPGGRPLKNRRNIVLTRDGNRPQRGGGPGKMPAGRESLCHRRRERLPGAPALLPAGPRHADLRPGGKRRLFSGPGYASRLASHGQGRGAGIRRPALRLPDLGKDRIEIASIARKEGFVRGTIRVPLTIQSPAAVRRTVRVPLTIKCHASQSKKQRPSGLCFFDCEARGGPIYNLHNICRWVAP